MITIIDDEKGEVTVKNGRQQSHYSLASAEGFAAVSKAWLRAGWDAKYSYSFSWFGRPIIQLPDDIIRIQEVIYDLKPDVIIETGVAHGGSLIFYASLLKAMGRGRVIGVDIMIRPENRTAIEEHELSSWITLIEGDSISSTIVDKVGAKVNPNDVVLILLDSCHSKDHVLAELRAYAPLVTVGSYIVATDGIMEHLVGAPRSQSDWDWNNPRQAALTFEKEHPDFQIEEPRIPFNEGVVSERVTHWPSAFLRRKRCTQQAQSRSVGPSLSVR